MWSIRLKAWARRHRRRTLWTALSARGARRLLVVCVLTSVLFWCCQLVYLRLLRPNCAPLVLLHAISREGRNQASGPLTPREQELLESMFGQPDLPALQKAIQTHRDELPAHPSTVKPCSKSPAATPCTDAQCQAPVPSDVGAELRGILDTQLPVPEVYQGALAQWAARVEVKGKVEVLVLTGASADHFGESQGLIQSLHLHLFPYFLQHNMSFRFVFYDLGLTAFQRQQLRLFGECEMEDFPYHALAAFFRCLNCYVFKPVIMQAHWQGADTLIWADASVRFQPGSAHALLKHVTTRHVGVTRYSYSMALMVSPTMMDYFKDKHCRYLPFLEVQAGMLALQTRGWVQKAVLAPWVSCAFSSRCMCAPDWRGTYCAFKHRVLGSCHRFDQAALGVILVKLFGKKVDSLNVPPNTVTFSKDEAANYFPDDPERLHDLATMENSWPEDAMSLEN